MTTDLILQYFHRDGGNWKDHLSVYIRNPSGCSLEEAEADIRTRLLDGAYFYAREVGLQESQYACEHDWHEFDRLVAGEEGQAPFAMTLETLLEKLAASKKAHSVSLLKVHKVPSGIPLRLVVSWLEFLRETRESIEIIASICKGKKAVVVFGDDDWKLLSETWDMDARSANFERRLRKDIGGVLGRAVILDIDLLTALRKKLHQIERRIKTAIRKACVEPGRNTEA